MGNYSSVWSPGDIDASSYINRISKIPLVKREEVLQIAGEVCTARSNYRREILQWPAVLACCRDMLCAFRDREIRPDFCFELSLRSTLRIQQLRSEVLPVIDQLFGLEIRGNRFTKKLSARKMTALAKRIENLGIRTSRLRSWFEDSGCDSSVARTSWLQFVDAKQRLAATGLRLVAKIAHGYRRQGAFMDLIQDGNEGLLVAADKFDPEMGCAFTTYASHWIHERISKGIHRRAMIRVPFEKSMVISEVKRELASLAQIAQRDLNTEDESKVIGRFPIEFGVYEKICSGVISLNSLLSGNHAAGTSNFDMEDTESLGPEAGMSASLRQIAVDRALTKLNERQKEIVTLRFGFDGSAPRSRKVIGREIGLTGERVRQIENETLKILRRELLEYSE